MIRRMLRGSLLAALALLALPLYAQTQTSLRIYGALSNFDCYNDTSSDAEGFEIEIEGIHKEDVIHTWDFSAFGAPIVVDGGTPIAPSAIVRYASPTAVVLPGGVTHFGVTLAYYSAPGSILRRWLPKPSADIPNPPPVPFVLPSHQSQIVLLNGAATVHDSITNDTPDGTTILWILPFGNKVPRQVDLEELMPDNAIVQNAVPMGGGSDHLNPSRLDPGMTWTNDDPPGSDDTDSAILWYNVYEDVATSVPHGKDTHQPGRLLGRVMDATITVLSSATPSSLGLSDSSVYGTQDVIGAVTIQGEAPLGGTEVTLASSDPSATIPATVTIPANQISVPFTIHTQAVASLAPITITASAGGASQEASFTIKPPDLYQLHLAFLAIHGGETFTGTVLLTSPAPASGTVVQLADTSSLAQAPASVTVPAGATSVDFTVLTHPVLSYTTVLFTAKYNGAASSANLTLLPFGLLAGPSPVRSGGAPTGHSPGHGR